MFWYLIQSVYKRFNETCFHISSNLHIRGLMRHVLISHQTYKNKRFIETCFDISSNLNIRGWMRHVLISHPTCIYKRLNETCFDIAFNQYIRGLMRLQRRSWFKRLWIRKELSLCHKLWFFNSNISTILCRTT